MRGTDLGGMALCRLGPKRPLHSSPWCQARSQNEEDPAGWNWIRDDHFAKGCGSEFLILAGTGRVTACPHATLSLTSHF
jgi:hypothetical protein